MPNIALVPSQNVRIPALEGWVDGYTEVKHKLSVETSGEPLEDGVIVQDHAVARSERLTLHGWVSDLNGVIQITTLTGEETSIGAEETVAEAWEALRRIHREIEPILVLAPWGDYPEMLITSVEAEQHGSGMQFTLNLGQVIRVGLDSQDLRRDTTSGPARERATNLDRGKVNAAETPD